ncbi:hypothetical protein ACQWHR_26120, partial [Salmonella enterica subsp. enterica serovar Infantis]
GKEGIAGLLINVCELVAGNGSGEGGGGSYLAVTALFSEYPGNKKGNVPLREVSGRLIKVSVSLKPRVAGFTELGHQLKH